MRPWRGRSAGGQVRTADVLVGADRRRLHLVAACRAADLLVLDLSGVPDAVRAAGLVITGGRPSDGGAPPAGVAARIAGLAHESAVPVFALACRADDAGRPGAADDGPGPAGPATHRSVPADRAGDGSFGRVGRIVPPTGPGADRAADTGTAVRHLAARMITESGLSG